MLMHLVCHCLLAQLWAVFSGGEVLGSSPSFAINTCFFSDHISGSETHCHPIYQIPMFPVATNKSHGVWLAGWPKNRLPPIPMDYHHVPSNSNNNNNINIYRPVQSPFFDCHSESNSAHHNSPFSVPPDMQLLQDIQRSCGAGRAGQHLGPCKKNLWFQGNLIQTYIYTLWLFNIAMV
jgi:hypothetical protein